MSLAHYYPCQLAVCNLPVLVVRAMGKRSAARQHTKFGTVLLLVATVLASEPPPPPTTVLEVNGATTKLDALGPVVVGKDGSLGLISGWAGLTPQEKEAGLAQMQRRNAKRLAKLKQVGIVVHLVAQLEAEDPDPSPNPPP